MQLPDPLPHQAPSDCLLRASTPSRAVDSLLLGGASSSRGYEDSSSSDTSLWMSTSPSLTSSDFPRSSHYYDYQKRRSRHNHHHRGSGGGGSSAIPMLYTVNLGLHTEPVTTPLPVDTLKSLSCMPSFHHPYNHYNAQQPPQQQQQALFSAAQPPLDTTSSSHSMQAAHFSTAWSGPQSLHSNASMSIIQPGYYHHHHPQQQQQQQYVASSAAYTSMKQQHSHSVSSGSSMGPLCRFCHTPGDSSTPLIAPCRCRGTLKFIHHKCLLTWLDVSKRKNRQAVAACELCNYTYRRRRVFQCRNGRLPRVSRHDCVLHCICVICFVLMLTSAITTILCFFANRDRQNRVFPMAAAANPRDSVNHSAARGPSNNNFSPHQARDSLPDHLSLPVPTSRRPNEDFYPSGAGSLLNNAGVGGGMPTSPLGTAAAALSDEEIMTLVSGIVFFLAFFMAMIVQMRSRDTLYHIVVTFVRSFRVWRVLPYEDPTQPLPPQPLPSSQGRQRQETPSSGLGSGAAESGGCGMRQTGVEEEEKMVKDPDSPDNNDNAEEVLLIMPPGLSLPLLNANQYSIS